MTAQRIEIRTHGVTKIDFSEWNPDAPDYDSPRADALYEDLAERICVPVAQLREDEEYVLSEHDDGRWGLFGLAVEGHRYAIETTDGAVLAMTEELVCELTETTNGERSYSEDMVRRIMSGELVLPSIHTDRAHRLAQRIRDLTPPTPERERELDRGRADRFRRMAQDGSICRGKG